MSKALILVIEDDPDIQELIAFALAKEGWTVEKALSAEEGLSLIARGEPDCLILDIMLPGMDGLALLRKLKSSPEKARIPVILATAKGEDADVVVGLELGAEDYVVKPFSPKVLVARIRAVLRRQAAARELGLPDAVLRLGELVLDPGKHEATLRGASLELTATEFALLEHLMRNPGRVFSRSQIIDAVKGPDYAVTDRAVDVQVLSLRKKLGDSADIVETVRGVGYRAKA